MTKTLKNSLKDIKKGGVQWTVKMFNGTQKCSIGIKSLIQGH